VGSGRVDQREVQPALERLDVPPERESRRSAAQAGFVRRQGVEETGGGLSGEAARAAGRTKSRGMNQEGDGVDY
jgi:hypothetical protein